MYFTTSTPNSSSVSDCSDFVSGPNATWTHVLVATTIDDGAASQEAQTFSMNITSLPENEPTLEFIKQQLMEMTFSEMQ